MKTIAGLALTLILLACGASEPARPKADLESLRGQWLVINYWAQWCHPCIAEIPELNALDQQFEHVTVLGVNYDGARGDDLARQERELGVEFSNMAEDPAAQLGIPRPVVLPTTLILDPTGKLTKTLIGPQTLQSLTDAINPTPPDNAIAR